MSISLPDESFKLPFPAFLDAAVELVGTHEWYQDDDALFHFMRALKAHPTLLGVDVDKAYAAFISASKRLSNGTMVGNHDLADEDGQVAFYRLWERVRFPMGTDPVQAACGLAGDGLIRTQKKRPGRFERFLTVGALLQIQVRQQPIYLPVRKVGEFMPCEPNTVVAWIGWAIQDGVLVKTKEHAFRSQGESKAAEYVFGLHLWEASLPKLGALVGLSTRPQDINWIQDQFESVPN